MEHKTKQSELRLKAIELLAEIISCKDLSSEFKEQVIQKLNDSELLLESLLKIKRECGVEHDR